MNGKFLKITLAGLGLAAALAGCGTSEDAPTGSGGTGGSSSGGAGTSGTTGGGGSSSAGTSGTTGGGGYSGTTGIAGTTGGAGTSGTTGGGGSSSAGTSGTTGGGGSSSAGTTGRGGSSGGTTGGGGSGGGGTAGGGGSSGGGTTGGGGTSGGTFSLTSPDHVDGAKFGTMYTCAMTNGSFGGGVIPELNWANVPAGTQSFAMTFIDTKLGEASPMGQHWAAWNIPAAARKIPRATTTSWTGDLAGTKQTNKYLAPCPSGQDTYEFKIFALTTATLTVTGSGVEGTATANSAGVAKVLAALKAAGAVPTATLKGTSGPGGN